MSPCTFPKTITITPRAPPHLDWSSLTASGPYVMPTGLFCSPVSTGHSRHPSPTAFSEFLCQTPDWRSLPTSGRVEIVSPNPLSGFPPKQTKGSSAWWTTYIVSQHNKIKNRIPSNSIKNNAIRTNYIKAAIDKTQQNKETGSLLIEAKTTP